MSIEENEATFNFAMIMIGSLKSALFSVGENEVRLAVLLDQFEHYVVLYGHNAHNARVFDALEQRFEFRRPQLFIELELRGRLRDQHVQSCQFAFVIFSQENSLAERIKRDTFDA